MKFISKPISKKLIVFILIFTLFSGLFLVNIEEAKAKQVPKVLQATFELWAAVVSGHPELLVSGAIGGFAREIIEGMSNLIWTGTMWFLGVCANLFSNVLLFTTTNLSQSPVYDGWVITRDIVNMFFILALVVIAFATILRIETYGIKALLPKLIIIALLINFSYLACGIIIDATHITANFFIDEIKKEDKPTNKIGIGGQIQGAMIDLKGIKQPTVLPSEETEEGEIPLSSFASVIIAQSSQSLVMFIAAFILLIGALLLLIRMGALWILIILAPFAWFFSIFPTLKGMSSKWWDNFLKYAFFAPIYVFFIYISLTLIGAINVHTININAVANFKEAIATLTHYLIAVIILGGAPIVAMSMGIYGSQAVIGGAKGIFKGTARGVGRWTD